MAKLCTAALAIIVSAFCFSSLLGLAHAHGADHFSVVGRVFCDPCRLEFETKLSRPLSGVTVALDCRKPDDGYLKYARVAVTDKNGEYSISVEGDHEEEICEIKTVKSTHPHCNEFMTTMISDRIVLTKNMGVSSMVRYVNPLGFMTKHVDPKCADIIKQLDLDEDNHNH